MLSASLLFPRARYFSFLFPALLLGLTAFAEAEVRRVTPPRLATQNLGQRVLCHRPMRAGVPRMDLVVATDGRIVVNNYGHGGSGWTLGPGSSHYVVGLLTGEHAALPRNTPVAVPGAGALGL